MKITFLPVIPNSVDLANTATVRIGIMLTDIEDDLPTTTEITPGTISIDRKPYGGATWISVVSDAAMSEAAGFVYYDEVFDSGSGYARNDSIRITFKSVEVDDTVNIYEVIGSGGVMFQTYIRQEFPSNFTDLQITLGTGWMTVGTNLDKEDYFIFGTKTILDDLQDISAAQVNAELDTALADINLSASDVSTLVAAVDAIKAKTDVITFTDAGKVDATIQMAADIKAAVVDKIADHILRRSIASALVSSDGDTKSGRSLAGAVCKLVNKVSVVNDVINIYEPDDTTPLFTQTATTNQSAAPIVTIDTD